MNELAQEIGLMRVIILMIQVHELYHVPICDCPRKLDGFHRTSCKWAQGALFKLNRLFRVERDGVYSYQPYYY
jgi:hypothetical protein